MTFGQTLRTRAVWLVALAAVTVLVSGCGGAGGSRAAFLRRANQLCQSLTQRAAAIPVPMSQSDDGAALVSEVRVVSAGVGRMSALTPPAPLQAAYGQLLRILASELSGLRRERDDVLNRDMKDAAQAQRTLNTSLVSNSARQIELGFPLCAAQVAGDRYVTHSPRQRFAARLDRICEAPDDGLQTMEDNDRVATDQRRAGSISAQIWRSRIASNFGTEAVALRLAARQLGHVSPFDSSAPELALLSHSVARVAALYLGAAQTLSLRRPFSSSLLQSELDPIAATGQRQAERLGAAACAQL